MSANNSCCDPVQYFFFIFCCSQAEVKGCQNWTAAVPIRFGKDVVLLCRCSLFSESLLMSIVCSIYSSGHITWSENPLIHKYRNRVVLRSVHYCQYGRIPPQLTTTAHVLTRWLSILLVKLCLILTKIINGRIWLPRVFMYFRVSVVF